MIQDGFQRRTSVAEEILFGGRLPVVDVAHGTNIFPLTTAQVVQGSIPRLVFLGIKIVAGEAVLLKNAVPIFQPGFQ